MLTETVEDTDGQTLRILKYKISATRSVNKLNKQYMKSSLHSFTDGDRLQHPTAHTAHDRT